MAAPDRTAHPRQRADPGEEAWRRMVELVFSSISFPEVAAGRGLQERLDRGARQRHDRLAGHAALCGRRPRRAVDRRPRRQRLHRRRGHPRAHGERPPEHRAVRAVRGG